MRSVTQHQLIFLNCNIISGFAETAICFICSVATTCTLTNAPPKTRGFTFTLTVSAGRIFSSVSCDVLCCIMQQKHAFFRVCSLTWCLLLQASVKMVFSPAACALLSLSPLLVLGVPPIRTQPEQVHLSYPGKSLNIHNAVSLK